LEYDIIRKIIKLMLNISKNYILGAIAGDVIGSSYEFNNIKSLDFELFTNDK